MTESMLSRLDELSRELCPKWQNEYVSGNGEANHYHLLFRHYPQLNCLSSFIGNLKSVTSRKLRSEFEPIVDSVYWKNVFWNEGYSVESVGSTKLDVLIKYIDDQPTEALEAATKRFGSEF